MRKSNIEFPLVMKTTNTGKVLNVKKVNNFEDIEKVLNDVNKDLNEF